MLTPADMLRIEEVLIAAKKELSRACFVGRGELAYFPNCGKILSDIVPRLVSEITRFNEESKTGDTTTAEAE